MQTRQRGRALGNSGEPPGGCPVSHRAVQLPSRCSTAADRFAILWSPADVIPSTCGSGGTGRRASLRSLWPQGRGGSSPLFRTSNSGPYRRHFRPSESLRQAYASGARSASCATGVRQPRTRGCGGPCYPVAVTTRGGGFESRPLRHPPSRASRLAARASAGWLRVRAPKPLAKAAHPLRQTPSGAMRTCLSSWDVPQGDATKARHAQLAQHVIAS